MGKTLPQLLIEAAAGEVGVHEEGGNNRGPRIEVYQRTTWLKPGDWPWCAAFCSWALKAALFAAGVQDAKAEAWRCRDASAFGWVAWARRAPGCTVLVPGIKPAPGNLVIFDFNGETAAGGGHIAIVESAKDARVFTTIEGNTGVAGARETTGGTDGVCRKTRTTAMVVNFLRLPDQLP